MEGKYILYCSCLSFLDMTWRDMTWQDMIWHNMLPIACTVLLFDMRSMSVCCALLHLLTLLSSIHFLQPPSPVSNWTISDSLPSTRTSNKYQRNHGTFWICNLLLVDQSAHPAESSLLIPSPSSPHSPCLPSPCLPFSSPGYGVHWRLLRFLPPTPHRHSREEDNVRLVLTQERYQWGCECVSESVLQWEQGNIRDVMKCNAMWWKVML